MTETDSVADHGRQRLPTVHRTAGGELAVVEGDVVTNGQRRIGPLGTERVSLLADDESRGFRESSQDALEDWDLSVAEGVPNLVSTVHSGTAILNRLVERESEVDVGILITCGMEETLRMGRGRQSYTGYSSSDRLHVNTHKHPEPLIPRNRIRGVRERIDVEGNASFRSRRTTSARASTTSSIRGSTTSSSSRISTHTRMGSTNTGPRRSPRRSSRHEAWRRRSCSPASTTRR